MVTHSYIYWENEDAGTVVPISSVVSNNPVAGMTAKVKCSGGEYDGKIIAIG